MKEAEQTAYLGIPGYESLLIEELKDITAIYGRLVLCTGSPQSVYWSQNIWFDPVFIEIQSIQDAAKSLRAIQRNWWPYTFQYFRRVALIEQQLPYISPKPLDFLQPLPSSPLGSWTLVGENMVLASAHCSSPMPHGEWHFKEDRINPPSRAYLKLWEFFTRFQIYPSKTDVCLDLGASPGGWTFVLAALAEQVIAYDRSPLAPQIMDSTNVTFIKGDAFKVKIANHPEVTWVFSDVVCFPDKLYAFIQNLLRDFPEKKYVFTIKFQGTNHRDLVPYFAKLPGQLVHLSHNKHELTWFKI
jgi:23S rRNA (cytidine2498-2'-O)-methyltransferase